MNHPSVSKITAKIPAFGHALTHVVNSLALAELGIQPVSISLGVIKGLALGSVACTYMCVCVCQ